MIFAFKVFEEDETNKIISNKKKEKNVQELEDLNFLLKSGVVLCKLVIKIIPGIEIEIDMMEVNHFFSFLHIHSISLRLET